LAFPLEMFNPFPSGSGGRGHPTPATNYPLGSCQHFNKNSSISTFNQLNSNLIQSKGQTDVTSSQLIGIRSRTGRGE
jgi:hypothetical protein